MSTVELNDIPDFLREKLVVNANGGEHNEMLSNAQFSEDENEMLSNAQFSEDENEMLSNVQFSEDENEMLSNVQFSEDDSEKPSNNQFSEQYNGKLSNTQFSEKHNEKLNNAGFSEEKSKMDYLEGNGIMDEEAVQTMMSPCRGNNCRRPPQPPCKNGRCNRPAYPNYPYHPCLMGGMCRRPERPPRPMPYYQAYPQVLRLQENTQEEIDMDRMKERYPKTAKRIQEYVEEAADRMDYDGSMMYDEYPDQVHLDKIVNDIYNDVFGNQNQDELSEEKCDCHEKTEIIKELIMVILLQQMFIKRSNNRKMNEIW